jgi:pimeloyl-ACP methyl ester carboxylesterase
MKAATVPEGLKRSDIRKHLDEYMKEVAPEVGIRNFLMTNLKIDKNGFKWKANVEYLYEKLDSEYASMEAVEGLEYLGDTILIGGANSDYIKWDERDEELMTEFFPFIEYVNIPDAGHWVHAEKPEEFLEVCSKFLNSRI